MESRIASAPVWAKRMARDDRRLVSEALTEIGKSNKSITSMIPRTRPLTADGTNGPKRRASGGFSGNATLFVVVLTLSTMGACAPDVRFTVAGCTEHVLSEAASEQVSATAPANVPKESA